MKHCQNIFGIYPNDIKEKYFIPTDNLCELSHLETQLLEDFKVLFKLKDFRKNSHFDNHWICAMEELITCFENKVKEYNYEKRNK